MAPLFLASLSFSCIYVLSCSGSEVGQVYCPWWILNYPQCNTICVCFCMEWPCVSDFVCTESGSVTFVFEATGGRYCRVFSFFFFRVLSTPRWWLHELCRVKSVGCPVRGHHCQIPHLKPLVLSSGDEDKSPRRSWSLIRPDTCGGGGGHVYFPPHYLFWIMHDGKWAKVSGLKGEVRKKNLKVLKEEFVGR